MIGGCWLVGMEWGVPGVRKFTFGFFPAKTDDRNGDDRVVWKGREEEEVGSLFLAKKFYIFIFLPLASQQLTCEID
jgi:hypothetical protein